MEVNYIRTNSETQPISNQASWLSSYPKTMTTTQRTDIKRLEDVGRIWMVDMDM